jgi:hypothetical protein
LLPDPEGGIEAKAGVEVVSPPPPDREQSSAQLLSEPLLRDPEGRIEAQAGVEAVSLQIKGKVQHSYYLSLCYLILKAGLRLRLVLRLNPSR